MGFSLEELNQTIISRASDDPQQSCTAALLAEGLNKCAQKLGEETVETIIAAVEGDKNATTSEAADLLYHLLVLLRAADTPLEHVMAELEQRTARSGLEEKASR